MKTAEIRRQLKEATEELLTILGLLEAMKAEKEISESRFTPVEKLRGNYSVKNPSHFKQLSIKTKPYNWD